jgi:hypothetical protein
MKITISVFFSGAGHEISDVNTLLHLLKAHINTSRSQKVLAFDGCGVTHGTRGVIFGTGLDEQCQQVIEEVAAEIKLGNVVSLNVYGHSRGAIAALMLAKQLSVVELDLLEINLALLDPVPGNLITTSTLDLFNISLAKKTMDLRECNPLKRVLALYPHQPLPAVAVHAPLFSLYPKHTQVEEEVIAGCHAQAQFHEFYLNQVVFEQESFIAFALIFRFLKECGSQFKPLPNLKVGGLPDLDIHIDKLDEALITVYQAANTGNHKKSYRTCHSATGIRINTKNQAPYFNLHHQRLENVPRNKSQARVTLEENQGPISQTKRTLLLYPKISQAKIVIFNLSLGLACFLYYAGNLQTLPLTEAVIAKLGFFSIVVFALAAGGTLAGGWYGVCKPLSQWAINRFFYPNFHIRHDIHPDVSINGSPQILLRNLEVAQISNPPAEKTTRNMECSEIFNNPTKKTVVIPNPDPQNDSEESPLIIKSQK